MLLYTPTELSDIPSLGLGKYLDFTFEGFFFEFSELGSEWQQPKGQGQRGSSQRGTAKVAGPKGHQTKGALPKGHQTKGAWPKGQSQRGRTKGAWPKGHSQRGMAKGAFNTKGAGLS